MPAAQLEVREMRSDCDSTSIRNRGARPSNDAENSKGVPSSEMSFGQSGESPKGQSPQAPLISVNTSSACAVSSSERSRAVARAQSFLFPTAPREAPDTWAEASDRM